MDRLDDLVREAHHRSSNDLQMVVSLLHLMARQAEDPATSEALVEASNRVRLLSMARRALVDDSRRTVLAALRDVCDALQLLAAPRGILIVLTHDGEEDSGLSVEAVMAVSLGVNELATNAIKHAFADAGPGRVCVELQHRGHGSLQITVEDDGRPLRPANETEAPAGGGLGLYLTRRLLQPHKGRLVVPEHGSKRFEIVVDPPLPATA